MNPMATDPRTPAPIRRILAVALGGCLLHCAVHAQSLPQPRLEFGPGESSVEIPFEHQRLLQIPVDLGGHSLRFVFDTGSPVLILSDPGLAESLGLDIVGQAVVDGLGDGEARQVQIAGGVELTVGPLRLTEAMMLVGGIDRSLIGGADGVIGAALFQNHVVGIDWARRRLTVSTPEAFDPPTDWIETPLASTGQGHLFLEIRATGLRRKNEGTTPPPGESTEELLEVELDTGARQALGLRPRFQLVDAPTISTRIGQGARGAIHGELRRLPAVRIGDLELQAPTVAVLSDDRAGEKDGWIGLPILSRTDWILDLPGGRVFFRANRQSDDPFLFTTTGLILGPSSPDSGILHVAAVLPRSPAETAGVSAGDTILEVASRPVSEWSWTEIDDLLHHRLAPLDLRIRRDDGAPYEVRIRPERQLL